jgi:hypothetical protein
VPLTLSESLEYIEHRLLASGAEDLSQIMSPTAAWHIAEAAAGIPRAINILADNVLIAGLGAGQRPVGGMLADGALREFIGKSAGSTYRQRRLGWPGFGFWHRPPRGQAASAMAGFAR